MYFIRLTEIIFFLLLFVGSNVLTSMGIDSKFFYTLILLVGIMILLIGKEKKMNTPKYYFMLFTCLVIAFFKLYTDSSEGIRVIVMSIIGAPILIGIYPLRDKGHSLKMQRHWLRIRKMVFGAYVGVTLLAIFERVAGYSVFGWTNTENILVVGEEVGFRSTAVYGHPLYNALMISIAMSFILCSKLSTKYKFLLWGLGYMAILCFNTRSSIVGNALLLVTYLFYAVLYDKSLPVFVKKRVMFYSSVLAALALVLVFSLGWGGRLLEMGLFDEGSAQVRADSWNVLFKIDFSQMLFGLDYRHLEMFMSKWGLVATENFWLDWLLRFGILLLVPFVVTLFVFIKNEFKPYRLFDKLFIASSFVLIASTNNSLSSNFLALFYFMILIRVFSPKNVFEVRR